LHTSKNERRQAFTPLWLICPVCHHTVLNFHLIERKNWTRVQIQEASADHSIFPGFPGLALSSQRGTSTSSSQQVFKVEIQPLNFQYSDFSPPSPALIIQARCINRLPNMIFYTTESIFISQEIVKFC